MILFTFSKKKKTTTKKTTFVAKFCHQDEAAVEETLVDNKPGVCVLNESDLKT